MPDNAAENAPEVVRLVNRRDQPVELHFGAEVSVIPPLGTLILPAKVLETPQIEMLIRRRVLAKRPVSSDAESTGEEPPVQISGQPATPVRSKKRPARTVARTGKLTKDS